MISASKSVKLAVRLTRGWVSSSIVPSVKTAMNRSEADSSEQEVLSERMKRNVITPVGHDVLELVETACLQLVR